MPTWLWLSGLFYLGLAMSDKLDATISISADTSGVEAGIDKTKRSLKNLGASAQGMASELTRAGREGGAGLDAIGKGGDRAAKQVEQAERSMRNSIQRQIAQMQAGSKTSREYWESLANQRGVNSSGMRSLLDQLEAAERAQKKAADAADGWGNSLRSAATAAAGLAGALSLSAFVGKLVSVQREFDVLNASLVTVTGSSAAAAAQFQWIKEFAKETPFGLKQATDAFIKMKSLGLEPTRASLTSFGNTASAMGKDLDQMIEAVADASTGEFERLKEFGIKASQFGETVALTFQGVTKTIGNNAQEIVAYLDSIGNNQFAGAMAERAKTLDGAIAELGDTWDQVFRTINENNTGSFIYGSVKLATGAVEDLDTILKALNQTAEQGAQATGAFKATQEGLATVFETVAVVGLTVKDTLVGVGREIGAIAAQAAALARLDFKGFAAIGDMAKEDAKQARAEWESAVNAILTARQRVADAPPVTADAASSKATVVDLNSIATAALNATKSYQSKAEQMAEVRAQGDKLRAALKQLEAGEKGASKEADQLRERLKGVDERLASMGKSGKAGASGVKSAESAILSYIKSLEARTAAQRLEIAQGEKLTESQRARIQLEGILGDAKTKASKSQIAYAQGLITEAEANEAWLKNASDVEKALADMQKAREQSLRSVQDSVRKLVEEAEATAYAEAQNISLAEAVERLALARAENAYQQAVERQEAPATLEYLRQEIEARKELVTATAQKGVKEANKKAAEQAAKDWEKVSQTIGDTLADYIMGGGKNAAQYLERLFSTLVLQPVVQTVVGGAMGSLGLGGPTKGGAGGSLNALSAGKGLWDAWSGSTGGMLASGVSALGSLTGSVFLGELGSAVAAGVELGISGAAALTSSASATTTAGMWLGAAAPWVAGIGALLSIVPSLLNGGTPHAGAASMYSGGVLSGTGSAYTSRVSVTDTYNAAIQKPVDALAVSIGSALDGLAKQFSMPTGYAVGTGFKSDNDDPSAGRFIVTGPQGETLRQWEAYQGGELGARATGERYDKDPAKGFDQYLQSVTAATIPIVQDIVPGWADSLLDQLSESLGIAGAIAAGDKNPWKQMSVSGQEAFEALQTTLAQIAQIDAAFDALGKTMVVFADLSDDMKTALLGGLGGMEGFSAAAQAYYTGFYSEQERYENSLKQMQEALAELNVSIDPAMGSEAKAQYRALVESAFADGNEVLATQLLALSGAFAQTADAAQAAQEAAQAIAQQWMDLENRVLAVQDKYRTPEQRLNAQYDSIAGGLIGAGLSNMQQPELSSMLMQSSKDEIYALAQEVWSLGHLSIEARNALLDAADALADLKDAAQQQRDGLMSTLWQMTGNTQALREKELAALDPANRALQAMIYTLGDLQNAAAEAAQKTQAAWSSWSTASGMALQYTGDTSGLQAQAAILRAQLGSAGVVDTGKLQELIGIEQSLFNAQKQKQEEAQRLQAQITQERLSGLRDELAAARALADAAKRLGDYAHDLFSSSASGLSESDRMAALAAEYGTLKDSARAGNVDAFGRLQSVTGDYLGLASTLAASGSDYSITAGRMAAELEALAKAQELVGQSQATGIEAQMEQLTAQTQIAQEQFEVSSIAKALIAKSMQEQADIWEREHTQSERLLELQERAALSLSTMHLDFGKAMSPLLAGAASNIERPISARLDVLIGTLSPANTGSASVRVPAYAVGTNVVPRDMLAQIHEGEAIIPKAFNPWAGGVGMNGGQGGLGSPAVLAEIRALREQNALLQALLQSIERNSQQLAQQFDAVTAGGNAMATEVMA